MINIICIVFVFFICTCIILSCITNQMLSVVHYPIYSPNIPEGFDGCRIVMLSDLHNHSFGENNIRLIKKIKKQNPDYIMIAGDMLVKGNKFQSKSALNLLRELSKYYPVYYAPGNHEERLSVYPETKEDAFLSYTNQVRDMGIHYLVNDSLKMKRNESVIRISGLQIENKYYKKSWSKPSMDSQYISSLIGEKEKEYQILLAHNPRYFEEYEAWGADLTLSGHVHAGMVVIPFVGGVISPSLEIFPKYDFGLFQKGNAAMVLSKGLAVHTIKLRLFHMPEISVLQLRKVD